MGSYLVYGLAALIFVGAFLPIISGIRLLPKGEKTNWHGEPAWILLIRGFYEILIAAGLVWIYSQGILDWFWASITASFLFLPIALYHHWLDFRMNRPSSAID